MTWRRGQTFPQDLRARVLAAEGTARDVAEMFDVSVSYVLKARQRLVRTGSDAPRPQRPQRARLLVHLHDVIAVQMQRRPDMTLAELRDWLREVYAIEAGMSTVWVTLRRLGLTRRDRRAAPHPSRRPGVEGLPASHEADHGCAP